MNRQMIDDQHVVARYLADQLSDADREAFEAYCVEHPETYRELEAAARLKVGLGKLDESGKLAPMLQASASGGGFAYRHAAVVGGLLVGAGALVASFVMMRSPMIGTSVAEVSGKFGAPLQVAASYEFLRMRESTEFDQRITLPASPAAIEFRVLPDEEGAARYRATLSRDVENGSETVATAKGLVAGKDHYVSMFVNSEKLEPGVYSLVIGPEDGKESEPAFRFEAARQPK